MRTLEIWDRIQNWCALLQVQDRMTDLVNLERPFFAFLLQKPKPWPFSVWFCNTVQNIQNNPSIAATNARVATLFSCANYVTSIT